MLEGKALSLWGMNLPCRMGCYRVRHHQWPYTTGLKIKMETTFITKILKVIRMKGAEVVGRDAEVRVSSAASLQHQVRNKVNWRAGAEGRPGLGVAVHYSLAAGSCPHTGA